ncbi:rhodanese-like domain-containing protein [Caenispirillum bisanense]|uniref:Rhodanese-related sulfurtransferase n=1 Tax=Caenispirillum bisanense TaxID=414052 RepID=A0A286GEQ6_9PROT|nr:rhodanese-like domain-containing protein [Caenispirillum bisanense]SOD94005.1 Rhodanese-related sulfurtransferase [Caenispirillum bisanense]
MEAFFAEYKDLILAAAAGVFAYVGIKVIPRLISGAGFIGPREVNERLKAGDEVVILDVREPAEFSGDLGHVPGAVNLPLGELGRRMDELRPQLAAYADTPVYVMCRTAARAASAARVLKKAGLGKVQVVAGGMVKWNSEKLPTTRR